MMKHLLFVSLAARGCAGVLIDNTRPRVDADGNLMDVHDGSIIQWTAGGLYYWYGMGYRDCAEATGLIPPRNCPGIYRPMGECGFRTDHALSLYTSPDLVTWTSRGDAFPPNGRPRGVYFRPKVIFNRKTQLYVLWINFLKQATADETPLAAYPNATYLVATSASPLGPFAVATPSARMRVGGGGDFALLTIADDTAYIAYDAWGNDHTVTIEQLDDDFLNVNPETPPTPALSPPKHEAPVLFTRGGFIYLLFGHTCCFCAGGAGARVLVSTHPLGPWNDTGVELNPRAGPAPLEHRIPSQNNVVFAVVAQQQAAPTLVFTADLWTSAPDGLKSHDKQYWAPLQFDDNSSPPTIAPLEWLDNFTLSL